MADIDRHPVEPPAATAATTTTTTGVHDDDGGFTFAAVLPVATVAGELPTGRVGPVYPVFGRPRSPPLQEQEEEDPSSATVRVSLGQLLLEERGSSPSQGRQPDHGGELDGVPAETYCLWSPGGGSPAAIGGYQSPARCQNQKSGSTGSVLGWRQRLLGRSHSDGKDKFVYILNTGSDRNAKEVCDGNDGGWRSFLPHKKKDLVGLFANAGAFRRSYHPF